MHDINAMKRTTFNSVFVPRTGWLGLAKVVNCHRALQEHQHAWLQYCLLMWIDNTGCALHAHDSIMVLSFGVPEYTVTWSRNKLT